jgi:hypothetical protein
MLQRSIGETEILRLPILIVPIIQQKLNIAAGAGHGSDRPGAKSVQ